MRKLTEIQITVNGGELIHTANFNGALSFNKDELDDQRFRDAVQVLYDVIKENDFNRLDGKRPEKCPVCKAETQEAGKQALPPYRDWECSVCSMNGHDGRFNVKV